MRRAQRQRRPLHCDLAPIPGCASGRISDRAGAGPAACREHRVSIVVPALDEAASIRGALANLQPLRAAGHEVIVVDGGSRDATVHLARDLADRVLCAPRGRASQMNAGAQAARGDLLLFLHVDTQLPEGALDLALRGLAQSGRCWGRFDVRIDGGGRSLALVAALMNLRSRWTGIATGDQAMFVARAAFQAQGGFPAIALMEDIALSARLRRRSPPVCLRSKVITSGRRWRANGVANTVLLMWWLRLRYWLGASPEALARRYRDHGR
ncbi:MAG: TIGR04283 family arsenosugar biosynthesis glycosyltransferase [Burkholderiales bacterium]|nr:TIGR04283 family arsenosugar biosynthesis glycosyltransferase [Burkholderiales bacterium]